MPSETEEDIKNKCYSLIAPHLVPITQILDQLFTRYGIKISIEFWIVLSYTILSAIYLIFGITWQVPLFFGTLSFLIIIAQNFNLILKRVTTRKIPETEKFLANINDREIHEVQKFLRDYRNLHFEDIKKIFESKHKEVPSIHLSILKYQTISGELLEYIVQKGIDKEINVDILCKYIYKTKDDISETTFNTLIERHNEPMLIKSLFVVFPQHQKNKGLFYFFSSLRERIRDCFNYGDGNKYLGFITLIITIIVFYSYFNYFLFYYHTQSNILEILLLGLNMLMGIFVGFSILFIIFKTIIHLLLKFFKYMLYIFAPSSIGMKTNL